MIINSATALHQSNGVCAPASSAMWARHRELGGLRVAPFNALPTGEVRLLTAAQIDLMGGDDAPIGKGMAWDQTWRPPD